MHLAPNHSEKDIVVMYHGYCTDGFAGAYAAWKRWGDQAQYIPLTDRTAPPEGILNKKVYLIDYSYSADILQKLEADNIQVVVLDHHIGMKGAVESVREYVFDTDRSGASIAWTYFFPEEKLPRLLAYIEDNDIWRHALPDYDAVAGWLAVHMPEDFLTFGRIVHEFEDNHLFQEYCIEGRHYATQYRHFAETIVKQAERVLFEGYEVSAVNCSPAFRSLVGHLLAEQTPPLGIIWYHREGVWRVSLRGNGSVDVAEIAKKYGGSGHHNAAAFSVPTYDQLPFTFLVAQQNT